MKWTTATEGNMTNLFSFHFRDAQTKKPIMAGVAYSLMKEKLFEQVEVLDESPDSNNDDQDKLWRVFFDHMRKIYDFDLTEADFLEGIVPIIKEAYTITKKP